MYNNGHRLLVIADDITGAAEIAGIAHALGHPVRLLCATAPAASAASTVCGDSVATTPAPVLTVIATDTRSMTEAEASAETRRVVAFGFPEGTTLFKKTDSALRGHVVAELRALLQATGYPRAVYMPANPSKGRIIRDGVYYIRGEKREERGVFTPLHETAFSYDPEFPAHTSVLRERFPEAESLGIIMPDAESEADLRSIVDRYADGHTLFAGAADLFRCLIANTPASVHTTPPSRTGGEEGGFRGGEGGVFPLILCGSTQSRPLDLGIPIIPMPREVYDGQEDAAYWFARLSASKHANPPSPTGGKGAGCLLTIPHTHRTGHDVAVHLRTVMADMARRLVAAAFPHPTDGGCRSLHLIIEGGATAWATLQALGWTDFDIVRQVAPGVVQMRSATSGALVTLKPGSYPWGGLFEPSAIGTQ